jgi:hypothetical protein
MVGLGAVWTAMSLSEQDHNAQVGTPLIDKTTYAGGYSPHSTKLLVPDCTQHVKVDRMVSASMMMVMY